jgi:hypothetical protein
MKRTAGDESKIDWSRVDSMTDSERHAAAIAGRTIHPFRKNKKMDARIKSHGR